MRARVVLVAVTFSAVALAATPFEPASAQTTGSSEPTTAPPAPEPPASTAPPATVAAPPAPPAGPIDPIDQIDQITTTVAPTPTPSTPDTPVSPTRAPKTTRKKSKASAVPSGNPSARGATSIEIDISRQTLYLYKGGRLYRSVRVSTGSGRRYCSRGSCSVARTPRGSFRIYNRIGGWRTSHLGRLYNPLYFKGGFAIHGGNIPGYPASHGCVRIPMSAARWFPGVVPNGTPVRIHD
jgi:lipoprotein-anchoring transpeptidase ErfK/SrfK